MIGPYELVEEIGCGGMGVVYKAKDRQTNRVVALKIARQDSPHSRDELNRRLQREVEVTSHLCHPNLIKILDSGIHEARRYIVTPLMAGSLLDLDRTKENQRAAAAIMVKVANAVHYLHGHGFIHRDLKPGNILLDDQGEPHVSDFGLACRTIEIGEQTSNLGTPSYMAPEQGADNSGKASTSSDIWALGVVLCEMLTGVRPFPHHEGPGLLQAIKTEMPLRPSNIRRDLDPALESIVLRCLEKVPENRYTTAQSMAQDLARWLNRGKFNRLLRSRLARVMAALLAISLVCLLAVFVIRGDAWQYYELHQMRQQLQAGQPVSLLNSAGMARWHRWHYGKVDAYGNHPHRLDTYSPVLLELLPKPPIEHFRYRVVFDAQTHNLGQAGIYFGHHVRQKEDGVEHSYYSFCYSRSLVVNRVCLQAWTYRIRKAGGVASESVALWIQQTDPYPDPNVERTLEVEIQGDTFRAYWQGVCVKEYSPTDLDKSRPGLIKSKEWWNTESPRLSGSLGFYVRSASTIYTQAVIEPLDGTSVAPPQVQQSAD